MNRVRHVILKRLISFGILFLIIVGILNLIKEGKKLRQGLFDIIDKLIVVFSTLLVENFRTLAIPKDQTVKKLSILCYFLLTYSLVFVH